jgi:hypothetical protein
MSLELIQIWTVAGILLGFQITSFSWRISREAKVGMTDWTWLPPADILNLISLTINAGGVFIIPIMGFVHNTFIQSALGLALLLFVGYPFALAGHYDMYSKGPRTMKYCPKQEKTVVTIVGILVVLYIVLIFTRILLFGS